MTILALSKVWICGRWLARIAGSNPAGDMGSVFCECCVLSAKGLCDGPFPIAEESHGVLTCVRVCVCARLCACVRVCVCMCDQK